MGGECCFCNLGFCFSLIIADETFHPGCGFSDSYTVVLKLVDFTAVFFLKLISNKFTKQGFTAAPLVPETEVPVGSHLLPRSPKMT